MKELVEGRLAIDTDGLDEEIRCEMCRNPMRNGRGCDGNCKYDEELYKKIIQAIDKRVAPLPSVQPEITDEQAIGHLQASGWMQSHDKQMYEMGLKERLADDSDSYDALLPSAQPERQAGKWQMVYHNDYRTVGHIECDQCGYHTKGHMKYNFCPNCGADMRGDQDE